MLSLLLLPALALAAPAAIPRTVRGPNKAPSGWTAGARASADTAITLRVALPAADKSAVGNALAKVSMPGSASYGKYLSKEEAGALLAPTKDSSDAVTAWLTSHGLTATTSAGGDILMVDTTVGKAEELLAPAQYYNFQSDAGVTALRTLQYGVPSDLQSSVEFVVPSTLFPPPVVKPKPFPIGMREIPNPQSRDLDERSLERRAAACADQFTPQCLRNTYGLGNRTVSSPDNTGVAIFSYGGHVKDSDVAKFLTQFVPQYASQKIGLISVDNGNSTNGGSDYEVEADLDVDVVMGVTTPGKSYLAISNFNDDFVQELLDFGTTIGSMDNPPTVLSLSYGYDEAYFLGSDAQETSYAQRACDTWGTLGTRGISVIVASGDGGVTGNHGGNCDSPTWRPIFPASCPYVTAVGGTEHIPETTVAFSGAGFSDLFPQPSYQTAAVASYLAYQGTYKAGMYNASGRAYPDVAAFAVNYVITYTGNFYLIGGTSASTPAVASIVDHLNDVQLGAGKPTLGFLNPWIYGTSGPAGAWNDITGGYSQDCDTPAFNATTGFDLASGWGTPNFPKLVATLP